MFTPLTFYVASLFAIGFSTCRRRLFSSFAWVFSTRLRLFSSFDIVIVTAADTHLKKHRSGHVSSQESAAGGNKKKGFTCPGVHNDLPVKCEVVEKKICNDVRPKSYLKQV